MMREIVAATVLAAGAPVEAEPRPSVAPRNMQAIAPALASYTDNVLFGDVWLRPDLSPRDRSIVTLSVLIATGRTAQMPGHLARGLDNGVRPTEVAGMVTQLAFYTGWPNAVSALNEVEKVFAERRIDPASLKTVPPATAPLPASDAARAASVAKTVAPLAPKFAQLTDEVVFADLWRLGAAVPDRADAVAALGRPERSPPQVAGRWCPADAVADRPLAARAAHRGRRRQRLFCDRPARCRARPCLRGDAAAARCASVRASSATPARHERSPAANRRTTPDTGATPRRSCDSVVDAHRHRLVRPGRTACRTRHRLRGVEPSRPPRRAPSLARRTRSRWAVQATGLPVHRS